MPQLDSIDWGAKRVFLHLETVTTGVSGIQLYGEIRDEIYANTTNGQNYFPPLTKEGGRSKGGGRFTPTFTEWRSGWRLVPHPNAGIEYGLDILDEIISLDGVSDREVFDRSTISTNVDIDPVYSPVETREIDVGSGLTAEQAQQILDTLRIVRGDEEIDPVTGKSFIRDEDTKEVLVEKDGVPADAQAVHLQKAAP